MLGLRGETTDEAPALRRPGDLAARGRRRRRRDTRRLAGALWHRLTPQAALLRWRLVLGPPPDAAGSEPLGERRGGGGRGSGRPGGARPRARLPLWRRAQRRSRRQHALRSTWLGDIRRYFPREVVAFMEKDAIERRGLKQLLLEPETLQTLREGRQPGRNAACLQGPDARPDATDGAAGGGRDRGGSASAPGERATPGRARRPAP